MKIIITNNNSFEWDETKNKENQAKHGVCFELAKDVFLDEKRVTYKDAEHSTKSEMRYKCIGKIAKRICTVRFTYRSGKIRIFGAGYWRKERSLYEQENQNR